VHHPLLRNLSHRLGVVNPVCVIETVSKRFLRRPASSLQVGIAEGWVEVLQGACRLALLQVGRRCRGRLVTGLACLIRFVIPSEARNLLSDRSA